MGIHVGYGKILLKNCQELFKSWGTIMQDLFIKFTIIILIITIIMVLFIICKKVYFLLKFNQKRLSYRIAHPNIEAILQFAFSLFLLSLLDILVYHRIRIWHLTYDLYRVYFDTFFLLNILILFSFTLLICNEFFPTIVTTDYICWTCQKVYQQRTVRYYYDSQEIVLYCNSNKLVIKRKARHDALIEILDAYYIRQEKNI